MGRRGLKGKVALALLLAAALPASASAAGAPIVTSPTSHDFGSQLVGTASTPFTFTLTDRCYEDVGVPGTCVANNPFTPSVSVSGPFAIQGNNCTAPMPGNTVFGTTCTFNVVFIPSAAGGQSGVVDVGDPAGFGKAAVTGTGTAPSAVAPVPVPAPAAKKCKKRHRASAAKKKCRKRR
jgi:hypothetical protein